MKYYKSAIFWSTMSGYFVVDAIFNASSVLWFVVPIHVFAVVAHIWLGYITKKREDKKRSPTNPEFLEIFDYVVNRSKVKGFKRSTILYDKNSISISYDKKEFFAFIELNIEDGNLLISDYSIANYPDRTRNAEKISLAKEGSLDEAVEIVKSRKRKILNYANPQTESVELVSSNGV